ncbi:hypothetical protein B0H14DRAFT_3059586 [Mycena olivaceomarginata]|nr:hypothetical protein B0H14DRAFT_3059586 [Mycena olivaceomarginata]
MPSFVLENGVVFGYTDSGVVSTGDVDYTTLRTFQRLHAQAQANSLRIISELTAFIEGNDAERASLLEQQGRDLAILSIPQTGGVALIGWSMGTLFPSRLRAWVHSVVMLRASKSASIYRYLFLNLHVESPSLALGLPSPSGRLIPQTDPTIAPEARGPAFAKWKYDNIVGLPAFAGPVFSQTNKALFNSAVREAWSGTRFWNIYGSAEPWTVIYGSWFLEDQSRAMKLGITSKVIQGSNHFLVWEDPEKAISELKECFSY